ncbi:MAG: hypothetical protein FWF56_00895 [Firmicutes bacterium]|nr:hypothetical protein [Bacillota bacterium]MCL1953627.1 hypothetical protein [Bacillota bacterium]
MKRFFKIWFGASALFYIFIIALVFVGGFTKVPATSEEIRVSAVKAFFGFFWIPISLVISIIEYSPRNKKYLDNNTELFYWQFFFKLFLYIFGFWFGVMFGDYLWFFILLPICLLLEVVIHIKVYRDIKRNGLEYFLISIHDIRKTKGLFKQTLKEHKIKMVAVALTIICLVLINNIWGDWMRDMEQYNQAPSYIFSKGLIATMALIGFMIDRIDMFFRKKRKSSIQN